MASIIKVDTIQTAAGGTPTAADLGLNTTGSVLQVVQGDAYTANATETTTTTGSWVGSSVTASITPSSTSSKIVVISNVNGGGTNGSAYTAAIYALQRDIASGGYSEIYAPTTTDGGGNVYGGATLYTYNGATEHSAGVNLNYVDSPSTTSLVTYRVAFRGLGGYGTAHINKGSRLILMEIAG